jgi:hypothetical protein
MIKEVQTKHYWWLLAFSMGVFFLVTPDVFALAGGDTLTELETVVTTGQKMTKTICYLIGLASGAVGSYRFVQTQSFATAGIASAISIAAFKFPTLVTAAAII